MKNILIIGANGSLAREVVAAAEALVKARGWS